MIQLTVTLMLTSTWVELGINFLILIIIDKKMNEKENKKITDYVFALQNQWYLLRHTITNDALDLNTQI